MDVPAVELVEWISTATARICFVSRNRTNSVRAFRTPDTCGSCAGNIRTHAQNWIRRHSPDSDGTISTLRFDLGAHTMDDSSRFWWQRCRWCHVSSISPPDRMCHGPKIQAPATSNEKKQITKMRKAKLVYQLAAANTNKSMLKHRSTFIFTWVTCRCNRN